MSTSKTTSVKAPTGTALLVAADNGSRKQIVIQNIGSIDVYLGGSDVTTDNGELLKAGATLYDSISTNEYYGRTSGSTANLRVTEITEGGANIAPIIRERKIVEKSTVTAIGASDVLTVDNGGTNLTSYTAGDLLYATGATTLAKLAKGTDGQVLTMVAGAPAWADLP